MNTIMNYFDLASQIRTYTPINGGKGLQERELHVIPQYIALVLGIVIQPFLSTYQSIGFWNTNVIPERILFGIIVGVIIFPVIYKGTFDPKKPISVQLCSIFALGMGWQTLLSTALKTF
jgi:hypothetical protein